MLNENGLYFLFVIAATAAATTSPPRRYWILLRPDFLVTMKIDIFHSRTNVAVVHNGRVLDSLQTSLVVDLNIAAIMHLLHSEVLQQQPSAQSPPTMMLNEISLSFCDVAVALGAPAAATTEEEYRIEYLPSRIKRLLMNVCPHHRWSIDDHALYLTDLTTDQVGVVRPLVAMMNHVFFTHDPPSSSPMSPSLPPPLPVQITSTTATTWFYMPLDNDDNDEATNIHWCLKNAGLTAATGGGITSNGSSLVKNMTFEAFWRWWKKEDHHHDHHSHLNYDMIDIDKACYLRFFSDHSDIEDEMEKRRLVAEYEHTMYCLASLEESAEDHRDIIIRRVLGFLAHTNPTVNVSLVSFPVPIGTTNNLRQMIRTTWGPVVAATTTHFLTIVTLNNTKTVKTFFTAATTTATTTTTTTAATTLQKQNHHHQSTLFQINVHVMHGEHCVGAFVNISPSMEVFVPQSIVLTGTTTTTSTTSTIQVNSNEFRSRLTGFQTTFRNLEFVACYNNNVKPYFAVTTSSGVLVGIMNRSQTMFVDVVPSSSQQPPVLDLMGLHCLEAVATVTPTITTAATTITTTTNTEERKKRRFFQQHQLQRIFIAAMFRLGLFSSSSEDRWRRRRQLQHQLRNVKRWTPESLRNLLCRSVQFVGANGLSSSSANTTTTTSTTIVTCPPSVKSIKAIGDFEWDMYCLLSEHFNNNNNNNNNRTIYDEFMLHDIRAHERIIINK